MKNLKISKIQFCPVLATQSQVCQVAGLSRFFAGHFLRLVHEWKVQSRGLLRDFRGSARDSLAGRLSSREKHLEKFSNFWFLGFSRLVLETFKRLGSIAKIACFAYYGLFSRSFSNTFHFSLMHHYHYSYLHLLPSFLIGPFVYSCQKGREYTISYAYL